MTREQEQGWALVTTTWFLLFAGHLLCLPLPYLCPLWRRSWVSGGYIMGWHIGGWAVRLSACSHKKSIRGKTLLWALKPELRPIPAEGCDDRLLLWGCHLNNDTVVRFEKTTSNEKEKCLSYTWLGRYQLEINPSPQLFLRWCTSKSTFRVVLRGTHMHPNLSFFTVFVLLGHLGMLLLLRKLHLVK